MEKKNLPVLKTYDFSPVKRWCIETRNEQTNKRERKYVPNCATLKERKVLAEKMLKEALENNTSKVSFCIKSRILQEFESRKDLWRRKTYQCKKCKLGIFTNWMLGKEWTSENIGLFFRFLTSTKKLNNTTFNDYVGCIKQALSWCDMQHLVSEMDKRKSNPEPAAYFTESQRKQLVAALREQNPNLLFFVEFVFYCFLRPRSELRLLRVGDVILEERKIVVPAKIAKNKKQQYIAIPDVFFATVKKQLKNRMPTEYLFPGLQPNKPSGMNTYGRQHMELLKQLGFDTTRYKMYSWKHSGAVAAVRAGVHIKELQIQLRHHSLDQVDAYLRQLGVNDLCKLEKLFPTM